MKHYKYGSSTAARTMKCRAWRNLSSTLPEQQPSQAALEGTAMHKVFEECAHDVDSVIDNYIGKTIEGVTITDDMADLVFDALNLLDDLLDTYTLDFNLEVTLSHGENIGGTGDILFKNRHDNIIGVADLKTGSGNIVSAKNNAQLLFMCGLMIENNYWNIKDWINGETKVVLAIIQPIDRRDDPLDIWETDVMTVLDFWASFKQSVYIAENTRPIPESGNHCKFCPASLTCPEKTGQVDAALRMSNFDDLVSLNKAMAIVDEVEQWCREVRKVAHEQAERGVKIDGWKLVAKRATRKWNGSEDDISREMAEAGLPLGDMYKSELKSPAQIETLFKKKDLDFSCMESYIESKSSGTTLAHDDDSRPEALPLTALAAMAKTIKH